MKFKNILSLSLVFLMTFTATLSSSASIFADNVEIPQTEESQSFGGLILEKIKSNYEGSNIDDSVAAPINPNNGSEIAPQWNLGTHDEIISNNYSGYIPEKYIDLVMKICRWCDDTTKIWRSDCMHGHYNYAASLKFLWKYAQVIGDKSISGTYSQLSANAKKVALAQFDSKIIKKNDDKNNKKDDYSKLEDLAIRTEAVINTYGKTKTPEERKYLIYGMILHLLGDITAHRTIVPKFLVDRATDSKYANSENRFDKKQFLSNEWTMIVNKVSNSSLCFVDIKNQLDEKRKSDEAKQDKESPYHIIRRRYEDNPKVVPNRLLASETMAEYFMHHFNSGFNISILDNIPYANVKLINYSKYRNEG